jgi:Domain of unknown function (DUF4114)
MVVGGVSPAWSQTVSPKQASDRPFGLSIVGQVMAAGSDTASALFQAGALPTVTNFVNSTITDRTALQNAGAIVLDPSQLTLTTKSDVRVYFVSEDAAYHNSLGFNTQGGAITASGSKLIFPDVSSPVTSYDPTDKTKRTSSEPLLPGDFVTLGTFNAGAKLDFFFIADGANGGTNVFSTNSSLNKDGINHVVSYAFASPGSSYLLMSFEDMYGGGDRDYEDAVFAVDIGATNVQHLIASVPEPGVMSLLCVFGGTLAFAKRRRRIA